MYKVVATEAYLSGLFDCVSYISKHLQNPIAASRLLDRAEYTAGTLSHMPDRFPLSRYASLASRGIHVLPVGNHCILFSVDDTKKIVYLHMFGYAPRSWDNLL